jgi:hypothetical protein
MEIKIIINDNEVKDVKTNTNENATKNVANAEKPFNQRYADKMFDIISEYCEGSCPLEGTGFDCPCCGKNVDLLPDCPTGYDFKECVKKYIKTF